MKHTFRNATQIDREITTEIGNALRAGVGTNEYSDSISAVHYLSAERMMPSLEPMRKRHASLRARHNRFLQRLDTLSHD